MTSDGTDGATAESGRAGPRTKRGPKQLGRRIGQLLYYAFVVFVCGAAIWQVTGQLFFPEPPADPAPYATCEEGLRELLQAIEMARKAAERAEQPGDGAREEAALLRYRAAIAPSWRHRDAVEQLCRNTEHDGLLDSIERLRYSEEHGVRHQAAELSALRARVHALVTKKLGEGQTDAHPKDDKATPSH